MPRRVFARIFDAVLDHDSLLNQKTYACGKLGVSAIPKVTAAIHILAYGVAFDDVDEIL